MHFRQPSILRGFSAICHFNLILHRNSNTCFNHLAIQCIFWWHSGYNGISDISVLDDSSTSSVWLYTCTWYRGKIYSQNGFSQNFSPLPLKHLTDMNVSVRKFVVYVLGSHLSFSLMTHWKNYIFCGRFLSWRRSYQNSHEHEWTKSWTRQKKKKITQNLKPMFIFSLQDICKNHNLKIACLVP